MALIGEMHYLTIGNKTYSIPISGGSSVSYLPTLTSGTEIGKLTVDSTTYTLYGPTPNAGTVTSVRVQATSPVQSSTSTAQSATLNTTISLANGYGDTKNPYGTKTANYVLAGPTTGSAAAPSFRKLVAADIPDLSGTYLTSYTETDPVFVASAAHGITSTDISNWNNKSDTDEKLKTNALVNSSSEYYPIFGLGNNSASTKYYSSDFRVQNYNSQLTLQLGQASNSPTRGKLALVSNQPNAYGYLVTVSTGMRTYTLPDATGTIALTSDIPTVPTNISAFTNDAGYITSADVPEGASAYTGTISAVTSGTSSAGTNNGFARGDHVHNITSSTITTALGYTPYDSTNPNGYISSYTDEKLKWTASTSSNTYYPLQSTSTATTGTANTLNSVSFYQYYNTSGGYRRFILGNATNYTSSGGAYGTIRLYGTGATYYGDLNPGTIGANSLTGNRTWTLPNATGTIALTSDIPSVPTTVSSFTNDAGYITSSDVPTVPTNVSAFTNDAGYITSYTDKKVAWSAYAEQGFLYPLCSPDVSNTDGAMINTSYASSFRFEQSIATTLAGSAARLHLGTGIAATSANGLWGTVRLYGTGDHYGSLNPGDITTANSLTVNRTWTLPDATGTIALTSDIPTVPTNVSAFTNDAGYITSYTDEKLKWTASTTTGTYYPLQGGYTATTDTASTLNSVSFYQYYNTAGGYRRLILGNSTTYTSTGGAYGTIQLYGTGATYYGNLNPGTIGANSLTAIRTWTLPDATGTIALTDNIPTITPSLSSGTAIATITQNGSTSTLYAPSGGGSSTAVIVSEEYTFSFSFDAGTIGTRGYQGSATITKTGYTPISVVTTYVGSSANYMPIPFLGGTNLSTLYCNIYRSTSSAVSNSSVRITVYYALDDGNAVSVNTYNGEVS